MTTAARIFSWTLLSAVVFATGCMIRAEPDGPPAGTDLQSELSAFLAEYNAALNRRDPDELRRFYVDDARFIWLEQGQIRYRSVAEVLASVAQFPPDWTLDTRFSEVHAASQGSNGAHLSAHFTTRVGEPPEGFSYAGVLSMALERRHGGWRIVGGHSSSPPPDPGEPGYQNTR